MIPKIIHYCWFGGKEMPPLLTACLKSWKKLEKKGYTIIRWDETNCDFKENAFVEKMYSGQNWAFLSDYFRLKAIYNMGGIYLDTDVYVYKSFDKYLNCDFFMGYIYDCALGTAVFGGAKGNSVCNELIDVWKDLTNKKVNNGVITDYFFKKREFILNGKKNFYINENNEKICIYNKKTFERGRIFGYPVSIHLNEGSWSNNKKKLNYKQKLFLLKLPVNLVSFKLLSRSKKYMKEKGHYQDLYYQTKNNKSN